MIIFIGHYNYLATYFVTTNPKKSKFVQVSVLVTELSALRPTTRISSSYGLVW